jgi:hypothetical protein
MEIAQQRQAAPVDGAMQRTANTGEEVNAPGEDTVLFRALLACAFFAVGLGTIVAFAAGQ